MTANLVFSDVIFQNHSPDVDGAITRVSMQNRSAVLKKYDRSSGENRESFLTNLEQISKDYHPHSQTQEGSGGKSFPSPDCNSSGRFAASSHPTTGPETRIFETTKQQEEDFDKEESYISSASNLAAVISILEKLGMCDSAGGSSSAIIEDQNTDNAKDYGALKMLIDRLGKNDSLPSAEMKAGLDWPQQFIANAQTGISSSQNDGNHLDELTVSRATEPSSLDQLMKGIVSDLKGQKGSSDVHNKDSDCGEKLSDPFFKMNGVTTKGPNDIGQTEPIHSAKNSQAAPRLDNPEKIDSIKLTVAARAVGVEASEKVAEASGFKGGSDNFGKTEAPSQSGHINRIWSTIDSGKQFNGESAAQNLSNNESSPVLKMIHNSQLAKENGLRMEAATSDELGGKITKVDVGANDNGLLSSQNQNTEKTFEAASQSIQTDTGQDSLRSQTLEQIVRKAVIYMRNGQHEAKIDLKPGFLGHVRMQVIIENHQVTVKILTESGFVKDMVENNIYQLKADLQQQGLSVDKLEVAVSSDSEDYKDSQEKAGQAKDRQRSVASINPGDREEETHEQAGNIAVRKAGPAIVDYFA